MNKNLLAGFTALVLGVTSALAHADSDRSRRHRHDSRDEYARVVRVEPLVERVRYSVPVEHCWDEERRVDRRADRTGATIVGGAVGALLGNAIGSGDGRRAATVGGAVVGAVVGSELARNADRNYRGERYEVVRRCQTHHEERFDERVAAYRVTYEYNGRRQVTRLPYDPGRYLRVAVDVHPLG